MAPGRGFLPPNRQFELLSRSWMEPPSWLSGGPPGLLLAAGGDGGGRGSPWVFAPADGFGRLGRGAAGEETGLCTPRSFLPGAKIFCSSPAVCAIRLTELKPNQTRNRSNKFTVAPREPLRCSLSLAFTFAIIEGNPRWV